jgi:hypothetical protein
MRTAFVFTLLVAAAPLLAQERTLSFSQPLEGGQTLEVDTYKGSVDVQAWDRDYAEIDVRIAPDDDVEAVELVDVRVTRRGERVVVETDYERVNDSRTRRYLGIEVQTGTSLPFAHYTIRMPRGAHIVVDDYKSEIALSGLDADVTVESYKGSIRVDGARSVNIDTYKGTARVASVRGGASVDTYRGDVEIAFAEMTGEVTADTYRGTVRLAFPYGTGFRLDADLGRRGTLDTDLPIDVREGRARGTMGSGGPRIAFETYRGTLRLDAVR